VYRIVPNTPGTTDDGATGYFPDVAPKFAVSEDGSRIAYSDIGPGLSGRQAPQIFTLDVATSQRRQVTRFDPTAPGGSPHSLLWLVFLNADTIGFENPTPDSWKSWLVQFDGSNLRPWPGVDSPVGAPPEGRVDPRFGISKRRFDLFTAAVPGLTENSDVFPGFPPFEIFRRMGTNFIQLTHFHRIDTELLGGRKSGAICYASGDPLGTNPLQNCQLFRVSLLGLHLRQLTRFGTGERSKEGCANFGPTPGCGIRSLEKDWFAMQSRSLLFHSDCDPFGANPDGSQVFAVDYDGSHLRQLTHTAGTHTTADGALEVELPGPIATRSR
jgi:hypothetical protein